MEAKQIQYSSKRSEGTRKHGALVHDDAEIKKHGRLLIQIGNTLGLHEQESALLAGEVIAHAIRQHDHLTGKLPLRICLAKMMVHRCLFIISSRFFNAAGSKKVQPVSNIPLSFWTVFKLQHTLSFSETEIAEMLNISTITVKERFHKALERFNKRERAGREIIGKTE